MPTDKEWMRRAIALAKQGEEMGEVPVGALITLQDQVIAEAFNQPISTNDPTAHAEILALRRAGERVGNYRLSGATLYVTLEPCAMCMGAMVHARIFRLVFGAIDEKAGAVQSVFHIADEARLNHRIQWQGGLCAESCGKQLRDFFRQKRKSSPV